MGSGSIGVTSQIERLRRIICHEPGPEQTVVTPGNRCTGCMRLLVIRDGRS